MRRRDFEDVVVPHLDAAFNYARWLTKNDADAEDVVQDLTACGFRVRIQRGYGRFRTPTGIAVFVAVKP